MRPRVSTTLREEVFADAQHRCGYCRTPQKLINVSLQIEHLRPVVLGGLTVRDNLWLSCSTCNVYKGSQVSGVDPVTGRKIRLYNPRRQKWERHFRWEGIRIVGLSPTGRATVEALQLNHPVHLPPREFWAETIRFPL